MRISRGLAALTFILLLQTILTAEYLYKDDVVNNPKFTKEIEQRGTDLYKKTGVSLKLVMIRDLPHNVGIIEYQKQLLQNFNEPTILLIFAELNSQIDISVNDPSLYKYFNRNQVLSPVASKAQAIIIAMIFAESFDNFTELASDSGGTILPLLGARAKSGELTGKYSAAMFNGYIDIAGQVAQSKGVELKNGNGQTGSYLLLGIKIIFYGIILMALIMYIRKKLYQRRNK